MARTYIVGNSSTLEKFKDIEGQCFVSLNDLSEHQISKFVSDSFVGDFDAVIFDLDSTDKSELCFQIALDLRLSFTHFKANSLTKIVFVSDKIKDRYLMERPLSQIFITEGVFYRKPSDVNNKTLSLLKNNLTAENYKQQFLACIKIEANAAEGRHSLANQWGASVLERVINGGAIKSQPVLDASRSLYFKYTFAQTLSVEQLDDFMNGSGKLFYVKPFQPLYVNGKKIMLIDDEADKGWSDVLQMMFRDSEFYTVCEKAKDYESLSENARREIETGDYDLIFLDLRMNGVDEENVFKPEDFSGMKILKAIKKQNPGTQVIMFTASNKAWNLKALLDAGANGYYIKESPEYLFPIKYSENNADTLRTEITTCLSKSYLRQVYEKIEKIKDLISQNNSFGERTEELTMTLNVAYELLDKANLSNEYSSYSYLQLFLLIEEFVKQEIVFDVTGTDVYLYNGDNRYRLVKEWSNGKGDTTIKFANGKYIFERGEYTGRYIDANYRVSALLIYKFGLQNSSHKDWTKVYTARNDKAAHPKSESVSVLDINRILDFMIFFFDENNAKWRDPSDAFEDISLEEKFSLLRNKFNTKK